MSSSRKLKRKRSRKAQKRRAPRSLQGHGGPRARFKMSEVISHLAEPILDEVGDAPEDIERVISLTVAAWNLTLFPAETREQQFDDLSRKFFDRDPEAVKVLRLVCDVVSKRKQQYYPHVNHLIFDVQFRREANDGVYFEVAYNLEPTGPRPSERASNG